MNMKLLALFVVGALLGAVAAESIRETELMDPNVVIEDLIEASGSDDEDIYTDYYDEEDSDSFDESSGSGDSDDETDVDLDFTDDTPTTTLSNSIEDGVRRTDSDNEIVQKDNDIEIIRKIIHDDTSNKISLASTSHGFFSRTEVVIAVVAGGLVGLVFAIIIVLVVMRVRRNKGDLAYDTVKKPIYKKAPTIEA